MRGCLTAARQRCVLHARGLSARVQLLEHCGGGVKALGETLVQALVAEMLQLRLLLRLVRNGLVIGLRPILRNAHHPGRRNVVPLRQRLLGRAVERSADGQAVGLLETL